MATLKRIREMAGLTRGQAAKLLGIEFFQLQFAEVDTPDGLPESLRQKMAEVYGVSRDFLMGGEPTNIVEELIEAPGNLSIHDLREIFLRWPNEED